MSKRDKPLRRKNGNKPVRQRFLIYCEGENTEKQYFIGVRSDLRAPTISIEIGRFRGQSFQLVEKAAEHKRNAPNRQEDRYEEYDQVWCVFDVEAPTPHPRLLEAERLAKKNGIKCAISSPCFEVWLYLHFKERHAYVTTKDMERMLEGCDCGYARRGKNIEFAAFRDGRGDALERARRLDERYEERAKSFERNPWTSVHLLLEELSRHA